MALSEYSKRLLGAYAEQPFLMAPMAGVTDPAYRIMCRRRGANLAYSEMVSVAGLAYASNKTWRLVLPADEEQQICVQLFGSKPEQFASAVAAVEERIGRRIPLRHCANTGATACYPEMHLDMVRPGLLLYGYGEFAQGLDLRPVMTLKTTISTTKTYEPGTSVSYGRLFTTRRRTRMGVVPYGYADGFFRCLSGRCSLMTAKGPAPQRGRICMDMSMIDLTDLPGVDVGDEVEIFGPRNPVEVMAAQAGTIPYELTCAVSKRVPRVYLQNGQVTERELLLRF